MKRIILTVVTILSVRTFAQSPDTLQIYFHSAAEEFNVPASILETIGYTQTRWSQIRYTPAQLVNRSPDVQPPIFGVMGLRDDSWFGHSLDSAAKLIGMPPDSLRNDAFQNIRGAAALLSRYRDEANRDSLTVTGDPSSWSNVIARYSGIPQREIALQFAYHTLQYLQMGVNRDGIVIPSIKVNLDNFPNSVKEQGFKTKQSALQKTNGPVMKVAGGTADYPGANWVGSPNYGSRNGAPVVFVIIHDTEGPFDASVSWLQNPAAQASSHYIIRSQDGYIDQLVHDADMAWGVRCWNPITLSIEHEGYVTDSTGKYFTETMYESSAHLTQYLCDKFEIPEDSLHIFGHDAWTYSWFNLIPFYRYVQYVGTDYATCNDHTDPGKYWKWHHYFDLIHSYDTTRPFIAYTAPSSGDSSYPAYSNPVITFNTPMDTASVDSALTITPNVPVILSFDQSQTQLTISHPGSLLAWSTMYKISIDSTARGMNGKLTGQNYSYQFTTVPIDTTGPALVSVSPANGTTSNPQTYIEFVTDEPVNYNSFASNVSLVDSSGNRVGIAKDLFRVAPNNMTLIAIRASAGMKTGMRYTASIAPGLSDYYGNKSKSPLSTTFTVDSTASLGGSVFEDFESSSFRWDLSASSTGIDTSLSFFALRYTRCYDGYGAGMLTYSFDSTTAVCEVRSRGNFNIGTSSVVGMWVFGDNSRNELDFAFGPGVGAFPAQEKLVPVDTLNWYGWKLVKMPRSSSDPSTSLFDGFAVRRLQSAILDSSTIFIDDLQASGSVTSVESQIASLPNSFALFQNYPNPFNPNTMINYQLPVAGHVTLQVYDVLGRTVRTLVNEPQNPGNYSVSFDASGLPSGVYFYRIIAGSYSSVKKMVVMK